MTDSLNELYNDKNEENFSVAPILSSYNEKKIIFSKKGDRLKVQQYFDKEKITLTKAGKTYNVYDTIQEANIDTDIYEVLKKYNCSTDEALEFMEAKGGMKGIYGEFAELQGKCQSLGDVLKLSEEYENLFLQLPLEIREKYGNNLQEFFKDLEKQSKELKEENTKQEDKENETK